MTPRLVIFDVDGTLVDSQNDILSAMRMAYDGAGLPVPAREEVLGIVGLSLGPAFARLSPDRPEMHAALAEGYRSAYMTLRAEKGSAVSSPLYPGAVDALAELRGQDATLLAVATGKSRRGLAKLKEGHGWDGLFASEQTADDHPSKPHPAMVEACLAETGVDPARAVMVGDTTYDMEMARAAGIACIGVSWGYHPAETLQADRTVADFAALLPAIDALIGGPDV